MYGSHTRLLPGGRTLRDNSLDAQHGSLHDWNVPYENVVRLYGPCGDGFRQFGIRAVQSQ